MPLEYLFFLKKKKGYCLWLDWLCRTWILNRFSLFPVINLASSIVLFFFFLLEIKFREILLVCISDNLYFMTFHVSDWVKNITDFFLLLLWSFAMSQCLEQIKRPVWYLTVCGTYNEEVPNDCIYQDPVTSSYFNMKIYMKLRQLCCLI